MLDIIKESPFSYQVIFEAVRVKKYFLERGITLDDIATVKDDIIQHQIKKINETTIKQKVNKNETKHNASLPKKTDTSTKKYTGKLKCPNCNGRLYVSNVCPGCKEGKAGKKLRFMCENFPECIYDEAI